MEEQGGTKQHHIKSIDIETIPYRIASMEASTSPTKPVSSGSAQPPPAGAPIKLTFKLGASVNPSTSSVATPSPPASEPMEYSFSGGDFDRDESMSEVGSTLGTTAPGSDAVPGVGEVVKEKPKRKRAPKRPSGEIGPGKHWRKGMKGLVESSFLFLNFALHRTLASLSYVERRRSTRMDGLALSVDLIEEESPH